MLSAARHDKSLHEPLQIEVRRRAVNGGTLFHKLIVVDIATRIFGKHTKLSYQKSNTQQEVSKQVKQLMWSAGIIPCDNVLVVLFGIPLSFSKSTLMHIACLDLFLYRYNLERAISFM